MAYNAIKRLAVASLAVLVSASLLVACNPQGGSEKVKITVFNSKNEIQTQMEKMAEDYSETHNVQIEMYSSKDDAATHLSTRYASNLPYTVSMVDTKDIYTIAKEHGADLSRQSWTKKTQYAIDINGKTYGFPFTVEARGVLFNAAAIEKITGEKFDPKAYSTLDSFKGLLEKLRTGGMQYPTAVLKEDWSLSNHYIGQAYEQRDNVKEFLTGLHNGTSIADDKRFNALLDTLDVLKEYNYAQGEAVLTAEREVTMQKLAEGSIAFVFGGNWDWSVINQYDFSKNMGEMAVPQNDAGDYNKKLVGGPTKYFFVDGSKNTSDAQRKAAEEFLNWLVDDEAGQKFMSEDCSLVSAFTNNKLKVGDPLGASVKSYVDENMITPQYNYMPDDHYSQVGASMQKYLGGQIDRNGLASEIGAYWMKSSIDMLQ